MSEKLVYIAPKAQWGGKTNPWYQSDVGWTWCDHDIGFHSGYKTESDALLALLEYIAAHDARRKDQGEVARPPEPAA